MIDPLWMNKLSLCKIKNCKAMFPKQMRMVLEYTLHVSAYHVKFIYTIVPIFERDRILILINVCILLVAADNKSDTPVDNRALSLNYNE